MYVLRDVFAENKVDFVKYCVQYDLLTAFHTLSLLHFPLLHFPPLLSTPAFSTPAFSTPAFSAPPIIVRPKVNQRAGQPSLPHEGITVLLFYLLLVFPLYCFCIYICNFYRLAANKSYSKLKRVNRRANESGESHDDDDDER